MKDIVKAIEVIEEPRDRRDFNNFALVKMLAKGAKQSVGNVVGVKGELFSKAKRSLLSWRKRTQVAGCKRFEFLA